MSVTLYVRRPPNSRLNCRHTLDDQVGSQNTHGGDTNARLCGSIRRTKAGEDNGGRAAHGTKEGLFKQCVSQSLYLLKMRELSSVAGWKGVVLVVRHHRNRVRQRTEADGNKHTAYTGL